MANNIFENYIKKILAESSDNYLQALTEAEMSAQDRRDSELLRSIIDKTRIRTNAKLTDEEKEVLARYGLQRDDRSVIIPDLQMLQLSDRDLGNARGGNQFERAGKRGSSDPRRSYHNKEDEVNYADIARKRSVRAKQRLDAISGDVLSKYQRDRRDLENAIWYRDYHKKIVDEADATYQKAIRSAREVYDKLIANAEKARDEVDEYHRPQMDKYAAIIDAILHRTSKP